MGYPVAAVSATDRFDETSTTKPSEDLLEILLAETLSLGNHLEASRPVTSEGNLY